VSHELRTPLAALKASVTGLRSGEVAWERPAPAELLAVMEEEVDHLNRLVGNLLDMARIEAGALKPLPRWDSLAHVLEDALAGLRRAAEHHQLEVDVPDDLPPAPVDHAQIEQVFANLIGNSLKYAPPGTTVRICARPEGEERLRVQIANQGPQVPAEYLERMFDPFSRLSASDRVTGTGLGLSICKGIIEAHGGRIWSENLPGGFAFNFTLPLAWPGLPPPRPAPELEAP
jgi:two-component system sensor histidine kinase KdpD